MKRILIKSIIFITIGFFVGEFIFGNIQDYIQKMKNVDTYYFLQEGVYANQASLQTSLKNLTQKIISKEQDKYHVYVGITKDKEVAEVLMNIYEKRGYKIYLKEKNITSLEFSENVNQFDLLIKDTEEEDQILVIEKVVLANYEEIMKKQ